MSRVTVSEDKSTFCRDKKPFFYLADTIWSAFTNITEDEWIYYLKRRKEQGFNVLRQYNAAVGSLYLGYRTVSLCDSGWTSV